ncbi:MAG: proteasome subunit beta [Nitriliruptorales bacterium]|nr:proteasome subunit beta [Nitriliruptorales bacterium]
MTDPIAGLFPRPFQAGSSSFVEVLGHAAAVPSPLTGTSATPLPERLRSMMVEGTTIVALTFADGVVMVGDRRATAGNFIAHTDMRKVFQADRMSVIGISGSAGPAMALARVFATELEHYEKVEGEPLSLEGKSNQLANMVRGNLPMAMQGLVVVPLFAGVDHRTGDASIFEYDPVGGRYLARDHAAAGSGSLTARSLLKRAADPSAPLDTAVNAALDALFEAADQDSATGGPDLVRGIYPIVAVVDGDGYRELDEDDVEARSRALLDSAAD